MSTAGVPGDEPERNLVATGRLLAEVAALSPRRFEGYLRTAGARALNTHIAGLEWRLEERFGRPEYWARDARRYAAALRFALTLPDLVVPRDIAASEAERLGVQKNLVGRFGLLLTHWPAIWGKATTEQEEWS